MGTDCSGIEAPLHALQQLGVPYEHVFSSEICPTVRKQLLAEPNPQILYEDATARDNGSAPYVDLYVAGWPCQGNSTLGKRRGLLDPRTRVVRSLLEYVHLQGPKVVVLENVANALTIDGGAQFREVCASLGDSGYVVHWRAICPTNVGGGSQRTANAYTLWAFAEIGALISLGRTTPPGTHEGDFCALLRRPRAGARGPRPERSARRCARTRAAPRRS